MIMYFIKIYTKNLKKIFFCATLTPSTLNERKTDEKNSLDFMCLYADIGVYRHTTAGGTGLSVLQSADSSL